MSEPLEYEVPAKPLAARGVTAASIVSVACFLFTSLSVVTRVILAHPKGPNMVVCTAVGLVAGVIAVAKSPRSPLAWIGAGLNSISALLFLILILIY